MVKVKVTQAASQRHLNFKQKAKRSLDDLFVLVAAVEALKIRATRCGEKATDADALFHLAKNKKDGVRAGKIRQDVKTRLAPLLSRSRKDLKNSGVDDLDEKVKAAAEGLLKGALK